MLDEMPIYEYRCAACQREFEYQQRMTDPDPVKCERCGADKLERLISWTSVRSNTWQRALYTDNPRESLKGTHAVDRSTEHRFKGGPTETTPTPDDNGSSNDEPAA